MIRNNLEHDIKMQCIKADTTQVQIAAEIGSTAQYVNHIIRKESGVVNQTVVRIWEALGYAIELTYVKRKKKAASRKQPAEE